MQQPGPMFPVMPSFPPTNITTEQIQKFLDENKKLILAILDNQNLGKLAECAQYQAQLQKNLMYLAAIADAQPQTPTTMPSQMTSPHPAMQQGGYYLQQQPQAAAAAAAAAAMGGIFPPFNNPHHQLQDPQAQIMTMRPNSGINSNNDTNTNTNNNVGGNDTRGGGNTQDKAAAAAAADGTQ